MQRQFRLKENRDFRRVFQRGKSVASARLVLYWYENRAIGHFRVGFSISRKVGKAVTRNLLKRRLRECFLRFVPTLADHAVDFVVVCRPAAAEATFDELCNDLSRLLRKARFMV